MAPVIRSTSSSLPRPLLSAGVWPRSGRPAVFLASEASDFVNGLILYVDGGILAYIGKQPR